jgi:hypothetical protein
MHLPDKKYITRLTTPLTILLLAFLYWVARYWSIRTYGLYEDDLTFIPAAIAMKAGELINFIFVYITHLYGHSRPLQNSFIYFFSYVGWHLAGLTGIYLMGYLITTFNIGLFFTLLRRVSHSSFALIAALVYALFSADTTQVFLTHSLGIQPALTFFLLACHLYLSNRKAAAYLMALLILFTYETPYLMFLAVPLLKKEWNRRVVREWVQHGAITGALLAAVFALRRIFQTGEVVDLALGQIISISLRNSIQGPLYNLRMFTANSHHALKVFLNPANIQNYAVFLTLTVLVFVVLAAVLTRLARHQSLTRPILRPAFTQEFKLIAWMAAAGVILLILAYPLTLTTDPSSTVGRGSRVHTAGVVGAAVLAACAIWSALHLANIFHLKVLVSILAAAWMASQAAYGFTIQDEYRQAWLYQRQFWSELLPLVQDAGRGAVILVEGSKLPETNQIDANTWNVPRILSQIYHFPDGWRQEEPRVYLLVPGWETYLDNGGGSFLLDYHTVASPPALYGSVSSANVIFVDSRGGKLERGPGTLTIGSQIYSLAPAAKPVLSGLLHQELFSLLISP